MSKNSKKCDEKYLETIAKVSDLWFNRRKQLFLELQKDLRVKANFISKFYNFQNLKS